MKKEIYIITWIDSTSLTDTAWMDLGKAKALDPIVITTVGILVSKTKTSIQLVMSQHDKRVCHVFSIPRGCIKKMKRVQ